MKKSKNVISVLCFMVLILFAGVSSGQGVNFSGKWKFNASKSKQNEQFSMAPLDVTITQETNAMSLERHYNFQGQDYTGKDKFTLDGKECVNEGWQGSQKKSTVSWSEDGKSLIIKSKVPMQDGGEVSITETLSMNGENFSMAVVANSPMGELTETYVFDKQ